jgi:RNA polymerase sigma-70 factor (ECF subfamily)
MIESTVNASDVLGGIGSLAKTARKVRRKQSTGITGVAGAQGISSTGSLGGIRAKTGAIVESMSDAALVELVLNGDQDVFAVLVERYKDAVQNLAYRMLGNATEAEDITQETFVRAYTQLSTYKPVHKFSTWLLSIASHLAIDQLRRRRFLALPLEDVPFLEWIVDVGVSPEQFALQGEQQDEMQQYLQMLPGKYRAVIVLRYWHDFSYEEIAQALNLTQPLVKARLHRARELLARYMKKNITNEEEQIDALPRR